MPKADILWAGTANKSGLANGRLSARRPVFLINVLLFVMIKK
jgi:hypothetical protein